MNRHALSNHTPFNATHRIRLLMSLNHTNTIYNNFISHYPKNLTALPLIFTRYNNNLITLNNFVHH